MTATNEKKIKSERKQEELKRKQVLEDTRKVLKTPEGYRFIKNLMAQGNLTDISYTGNSMTFFNEGHRNFAKIIFQDVIEADEVIASKIIVDLNKKVKEN